MGIDYNIISDPELGRTYYGSSVGIGIGTPGVEGHVSWGNTWSLYQGNILRDMNSVANIMRMNVMPCMPIFSQMISGHL